MIKKIVVTNYDKDLNIAFVATLTTKSGIVANDFKSRKELIQKVVLPHLSGPHCKTVQWICDGNPEGYLIRC